MDLHIARKRPPREVLLRIERADPRGTRIERSKGGNGKKNVAGFLTNDAGPDSPFLTWAFFRYGFLPNLLTFSGTMLQNLALDRKMKSKSLDINHISI
jgi:hypothetical protein